MSTPIAESPIVTGCNHSEVEGLGNAGFVEFYLCRRCHDVVVMAWNRRWAVAAASREE